MSLERDLTLSTNTVEWQITWRLSYQKQIWIFLQSNVEDFAYITHSGYFKLCLSWQMDGGGVFQFSKGDGHVGCSRNPSPRQWSATAGMILSGSSVLVLLFVVFVLFRYGLTVASVDLKIAAVITIMPNFSVSTSQVLRLWV